MEHNKKRLATGFYALLSLPSTAMGFGLCVQISALSWILSTKYGLAIDEVGWVWMAGPLAGIVGQLLAGVLSDNLWFMGGRRRPLIIFGGLMAGLMILCLPQLDLISKALGTTEIIWVALTVALMLDLAINIGFNPTRAIIADLTPEGEARTHGYTVMQTVSGAFGVLAYLIGAFIGNMELIYIGAGVVMVFSIVPALLLKEPRELASFDAQSESQNETNAKQLMAIYLAHAFTWLGVQTMFVYMYAYVSQKMGAVLPEDLGQMIGIAFAVMNVVGFLLPALVLVPLSRKFGRVRVHAACLGIMAMAFFLVLVSGGNVLFLYLTMALIGIGWASVVSLPFAIMTEYVSPKRTGLFMGIFNLSVVIPQVVVSGAFGLIFSRSGNLDIIFVICGLSLTVSALLWAVLVKDKQAVKSL